MTLIERLEALTEPDREVDAEIWALVHEREIFAPWDGTYFEVLSNRPLMPGEEPPATTLVNEEQLTRYTASIDAAITLVPDGWEWLRESPETMCAYLPKHDDKKSWAIHITGVHKSPAIALCIAALKARGVK